MVTRKGEMRFYHLETLVEEYGRGGSDAIRKLLGFHEFVESKLPKRAVDVLRKVENDINVEQIPLKDFSSTAEVQEIITTTTYLDASVGDPIGILRDSNNIET